MKRYLYWFVWLQIMMPLCVAAAAFAVMAANKEAHRDSVIISALFIGFFTGSMGTLIFAPILAVNSAIMIWLLTQSWPNRTKAVLLMIDCLIAYIAVQRFVYPTETLGVEASITWFATGVAVTSLALRMEPGEKYAPLAGAKTLPPPPVAKV